MFKIENGRKQFYQWDVNQRLIVENETILEVHFSNATITTAIEEKVYTDAGKRVVNVPNSLLQSAFDLKVYGCCADCVRYDAIFQVVARNKPADYVYYELVGGEYKELESRVEVLENNSGIGIDLDNYYTKAETDAAIKAHIPTIDLTGYATESYVNDKVADIDLSGYALKTDIPTLEGYATEKYVNDAIGAIPKPDLSGYYTKTEIDSKGYLTEHQDLSNYALKTDIPNTSNFITMAAVEAKGYQTAAQVEEMVNNALGVIENGTY